MAGRMQVGPMTLVDGGAAALSAANALEESLNSLQRFVSGLDQSWASAGNTEFNGYYELWNAAAIDLHVTLGRLRNLLLTAHGNYHAAEGANLSIWARR